VLYDRNWGLRPNLVLLSPNLSGYLFLNLCDEIFVFIVNHSNHVVEDVEINSPLPFLSIAMSFQCFLPSFFSDFKIK
jgi:hypothetical protein